MAKFYNKQIGLDYCNVCNVKLVKDSMVCKYRESHDKGYISFT